MKHVRSLGVVFSFNQIRAVAQTVGRKHVSKIQHSRFKKLMLKATLLVSEASWPAGIIGSRSIGTDL